MTSLLTSDRVPIAIDTREQTPWAFPVEYATVRRDTLSFGDYSVQGDIGLIIERKSLNDLVGSVSTGWDRLVAEFDRAGEGVQKIVVVEATASEIVNHKYNHPQIEPAFVFKRMAELVVYHNVMVLLGDGPVTSAGLAYTILKRRWEMIHSDRKL